MQIAGAEIKWSLSGPCERVRSMRPYRDLAGGPARGRAGAGKRLVFVGPAYRTERYPLPPRTTYHTPPRHSASLLMFDARATRSARATKRQLCDLSAAFLTVTFFN